MKKLKRISMAIAAEGHYSKKITTILARVSEDGKWAEISARQLRAAEDRACDAGTDYLDLPEGWEPRQDGSAYHLI